jgi:hypothetical protein
MATIKKLKVMLDKKDTDIQASALEIITLLPTLSQNIIQDFLRKHESHHPSLCDLLCFVQLRIEKATVEEITAIAFTAAIVGQRPWSQLPMMFS